MSLAALLVTFQHVPFLVYGLQVFRDMETCLALAANSHHFAAAFTERQNERIPVRLWVRLRAPRAHGMRKMLLRPCILRDGHQVLDAGVLISHGQWARSGILAGCKDVGWTVAARDIASVSSSPRRLGTGFCHGACAACAHAGGATVATYQS